MLKQFLCLVFFLVVSIRSDDIHIQVQPGVDQVIMYQTQLLSFPHAGLDVQVIVESFLNTNPTACYLKTVVEVNISDTQTVSDVGVDFVVQANNYSGLQTAAPYFENCGNPRLEVGGQVIPVKLIVKSNCSLSANGTINGIFQYTQASLNETRPVRVSPVGMDFDTFLTFVQDTASYTHLQIVSANKSAAISDYFSSIIIAYAGQCINKYDPLSPNRKEIKFAASAATTYSYSLGAEKIYYARLIKKSNVTVAQTFNVVLVLAPSPVPTPNNVGIAIGITLPLLVVIFVVVYICYRRNSTYKPVY